MKILFFSHSKRANGGAERCLLDLIKGIKQAQPSWEIYVIFPAKGELWEMCHPYLSGYAFINQPWWLVRPSKKGLRKRALFYLKKRYAIRQTQNYIRQIAPDIAITNTLATPIGALAAHTEHIPHLWFIHEIPELAQNLTYLFSQKESLRQVDILSQHMIVPSKFAGEHYAQSYFKSDKISVIYQAVEVNISKRPEKKDVFTIGMLGNFETNKGQHIAIDALQEITTQYPDTHLLLIGGNNSQYTQNLKKQIIAYGLQEKVSIIDHTLYPHDYLIQADIALVCSRFECFGRVIVEGLKCGLPVIAPNNLFGKELITEGKNGLLFNRDEPSDLARKIISLRQDDITEMKKEALASVENRFTTQSFANNFIDIIHTIIP